MNKNHNNEELKESEIKNQNQEKRKLVNRINLSNVTD